MGDRAVHIAIRMFTSIETRIAYVYKSIVACKELGKTTNYNHMGVYNQRQKLSFIFRDNFRLAFSLVFTGHLWLSSLFARDVREAISFDLTMFTCIPKNIVITYKTKQERRKSLYFWRRT